MDEPDERGRLLWLHPVHVFRAPDSTELKAAALAPTFRETITINGGTFAAGIDSSAIIASAEKAEETPVRLTKLHWAYYALYMKIDRRLLGVLDQQRWSERAPLDQLEAEAEDVFADYLRVMDARARLDSTLGALGGDELAIWETIAKAQRFEAVVESVERKLAVMEKVAQHRVVQATAHYDRRIGRILGALTVLSLIALVGGVISVIAGSVDPARWSFEARLGVLIGAVAFAVVLYSWIFFSPLRRLAVYVLRRRKS